MSKQNRDEGDSDSSTDGSLEGIIMDVDRSENQPSECELAQPPRPKTPTPFLRHRYRRFLHNPECNGVWQSRNKGIFKAPHDNLSSWSQPHHRVEPYYYDSHLLRPQALRCQAINMNDQMSSCPCRLLRLVGNSSKQPDDQVAWMNQSSLVGLAYPGFQASTSSAAEPLEPTVPITADQPRTINQLSNNLKDMSLESEKTTEQE